MTTSNSIYDAIILGGGLMGAATADALAQRGKKTLLVEQFEPGHTRGSSHGDGRIIRMAYPEAIYVEMALLAYPAWDDLARRAGQPLVQQSGGWDCGPADSADLAQLEANFQQYGIAYERLSAAESNRRFPHFHLPPGSDAVYQAEAGVVFATPAVQALWRVAQAAGAEALTKERVVAVEPQGDLVTVRGASGAVWQGKAVVVAGGGWSGKILAALDLALPLAPTQEQVAYFPIQDGPDHRVGAMPVFIDYHTPEPFYGLPEVEIPGVKIGWHHTGPVIDPDEPRPFSEENLRGVQRFVAERFPHLGMEATERLTCIYTNTPDYHFILDRHPAYPNIVIGTGFSGHGFKFGPVIGQILAALALDEPPPLALDTFALARFGT